MQVRPYPSVNGVRQLNSLKAFTDEVGSIRSSWLLCFSPHGLQSVPSGSRNTGRTVLARRGAQMLGQQGTALAPCTASQLHSQQGKRHSHLCAASCSRSAIRTWCSYARLSTFTWSNDGGQNEPQLSSPLSNPLNSVSAASCPLCLS